MEQRKQSGRAKGNGSRRSGAMPTGRQAMPTGTCPPACPVGRSGRRGQAIPAGRLLWAVCLVGVILAPAGVWAQDSPASTDTEIVAQVRFTREQFVELTNKMLEVADLLEQAEPETAQMLREAVSQARRAFIAEDMERVASLLTQGLVSAAASGQAGVIEELGKVLELLRSGVLDLEDHQQRIQQWRQQLERIRRILSEQQRLEQQSRVKANQDEIDRQFDELSQRVRSLIERQEQLRQQTAAQDEAEFSKAVSSVADLLDHLRDLKVNQQAVAETMGIIGIDRLPLLGEIQRQLGGETRRLAEKIGELADDEQFAEEVEKLQGDPAVLGRAGRKMSDAATSMDRAADELAKPDSAQAGNRAEDALADLADAEQMLADLLDRSAANSPAGRLAAQQAEIARRTDELTEAMEYLAKVTGHPAKTEHIDAASREMADATGDLQAQRRDEALDHQDEAIRQLKDEQYRLAQLRQRVKQQEQRNLPDQGAEQADLADRTRRTADDMQGKDQSQQMPGAGSMERASDAMDQAADMLDGDSSGGSESRRASQANSDQREAIEHLQRAMDDLAEAIEQEQERIESEQLAKIDELLQKALDSQRQISEATIKVYACRDRDTDDYDRPEQLKLAELAEGEGDLSDDVGRVRNMLAEEGVSVVFPIVLKQVQDDLGRVQRRLDSLKADEETQAIQEDIELSLAEMIAAIREELSQRRNRQGPGGGPGCGCGGGSGPLVPPIAELKMLRCLQLQIANQTNRLNGQLDTLPADEAGRRHARLAERQQQLQEMTTALAERLEQQQQTLQEQERGQP